MRKYNSDIKRKTINKEKEEKKEDQFYLNKYNKQNKIEFGNNINKSYNNIEIKK